MLTQPVAPSSGSWKLPKRLMPLIFAFYMSSVVALLVACALVTVKSGLEAGYIMRVLDVYKFAMPVAFVSVLSLRTTIMRLTAATLQS
ncbi:MAG: DUF2798 domain-containing protein [Pseudomonas sp.]